MTTAQGAPAPRYAHTQHGTTLRLAALIPLVAGFGFAFLDRLGPPQVRVALLAAMVVVAITVLLFSSLTIEVGDVALRWRFGPGLWRKTVALAEIASVAQVKNPWWYGFGIHLTPRGWLYNVGGSDAVEVVLTSGKAFRLGTDEPEVLARALTSHTTSQSSG